MSSRPFLFLPLVLCAALAGCASKPVETVTLKTGSVTLIVEVARTPEQREHGLMGRKDLGPRSGMIFVFDRDDHLTFWMKNTPTPLSIAFLSSDGKVLEIKDMQPFSETVIRSRLSARYALEMKQGAFAEMGVHEGDTFVLPPDFP